MLRTAACDVNVVARVGGQAAQCAKRWSVLPRNAIVAFCLADRTVLAYLTCFAARLALFVLVKAATAVNALRHSYLNDATGNR